MVSPEMVVLSVFITPCTNPTSIHRATSDACTATTDSSRPEGAAVAAWENAMAAYHEQRFGDAAARFATIAAANPADGAARVLAERARVLADAPPPPDWDGVYEQRSK